MNIDRLAEDYSYQSPYNFAENRVVDGRELEGLEWRSSTSSDGKTVNLVLTVRTVNNSGGVITNEQMATLANERANALNSTVGGKDSSGRTVNVCVDYSDKATMVWEYTGTVDTSKTSPNDRMGKSAEKLQQEGNLAQGWTDKVGDTQNNRTQIGLNPTIDGWSDTGKFKFWSKAVRAALANTGAHEDGHALGGRHEDDDKNTSKSKQEQASNPNSLMNNGAPGSDVSPAQRTEFVNQVEQQQPR